MRSNDTNDTLNITTLSYTLSILEQNRLNYPRWGYTIVGVILVCVCVVGTLSNIVIFRIFMVNKQLVSPTNVFIIGLFICDFAMALFGVPLAAAAAFAGHWTSGSSGCVAEAVITYVLGLTSLYIHTAISIDRYAVISQPIRTAAITKRVAILSVLGCFFLGVLFATPPLVGWNGYGLEVSGVSCGLQYRDKSLSSKSYIVTIFVFCFMLPVLVMVYCYFNLYSLIKKMSRSNSVLGNNLANRNSRVERKMLKTCGAIVASYWLCWTPYAVVSFWQSFGDVDHMPVTVSLLPATAAKSQLMLNPLIYVATNEQFRIAMVRMLPCKYLQKLFTNKDDGIKESEMETENKTVSCVGGTRNAIGVTDTTPVEVITFPTVTRIPSFKANKASNSKTTSV